MKKVFCYIFIFAVLLSPPGGGASSAAHAEVVSDLEFDNTDIMADLGSMTINGKAFSLADYPFIEGARPQFLTFAEYAYTFKKSLQGNYGMYLYIYNPSGGEINFLTYFNKIQMAAAFEGDKAVGWDKFDLLFCSRSGGAIANLFYKFRVLDKVGADGKTVLERVNSVARVYDISGIELAYAGAANATEYKIGGRYIFTGYAKGYGVSVYDESTLGVKYSEFDTVELEVGSTFYRTPSSDKGKGYKYQLNSVYFAFEDRYIDDYGALSRILATAYEYTTKNIVVTQSNAVYERFIEFIGEYIDYYNAEIGRSLYLDLAYQTGFYMFYKWALNPYYESDYAPGGGEIEDVLYYLFYVDDIRADVVTGEELGDWILNYAGRFGGGTGETLPIKDGTISADLFQAGGGERVFDVDTTDRFNMLVYGEGWFNTLIDYGATGLFDWFGKSKIDFGVDVKDIKPIYELSDGDFDGSDGEIAQRLLISAGDVQDLKTYYSDQKKAGKKTCLFRYSVTDYYAEDLSIYEHINYFFSGHWEDQAYVAREMVYFDFDIIELTFTRDGIDTVIPAVMSPIDIFADVETPLYAADGNFYWIILTVLAVVILGGLVVLVWLKL
jgi:hypothetical protein